MRTPTVELVQGLWDHMEDHCGTRRARKTAVEMQLVGGFLDAIGILDAEDFLSRYTTTIGRTIYTPWEVGVGDLASQMLICVHEHQHVHQYLKGGVTFAWEEVQSRGVLVALRHAAQRPPRRHGARALRLHDGRHRGRGEAPADGGPGGRGGRGDVGSGEGGDGVAGGAGLAHQLLIGEHLIQSILNRDQLLREAHFLIIEHVAKHWHTYAAVDEISTFSRGSVLSLFAVFL